jgi:glycosyltransferase involved in cell wall biosynthesis
MRIAFVTSLDPTDRRSWSGIYFHMVKALQTHVGEVVPLGPAPFSPKPFGLTINRVTRRLLGRTYDYDHSRIVSMAYGAIFGRRLEADNFDIIFAPAASTEIAHLNTDIPIVYCSDTTFALMRDYYPSFTNIFGFSAREADSIEAEAIHKAAALLYPSPWAAGSAIDYYKADPARVHVIPMGANIDDAPEAARVGGGDRIEGCSLLFLGNDWERKGGPIAFDTLICLIQMGIDAELVVCGCVPPARFSSERMTVINFLDKNKSEDRESLARLLWQSHFLIAPTRAECYGIAFCEANAYGVPVLATDTGGVSGVIRDGVNGFKLPHHAVGADYARLITGILADRASYNALIKSSRAEFDRALNWDAWGRQVAEVVSTGLRPTAKAKAAQRLRRPKASPKFPGTTMIG